MPFVPDRAALTPAFLARHVAPHVPGVEVAAARVLPTGDANYAVDFGAVIVRLPRDAAALQALVREAAVCAALPAFPGLATPRPRVEDGAGYPFSWHRKILGEHLTTEAYGALTESQKGAMAATLARFFAALHAATDHLGPLVEGRAPWYRVDVPLEQVRALAPPLLPPDLQEPFARLMEAWGALAVPPGDRVFAYLDSHGQNIAFDAHAGRLVGLYDFADCAVEDYHAEFAPLDMVHPDLTARAAQRYAALTGRAVHLPRVRLYTILRDCVDLCEAALGRRRGLMGDTVESLVPQLRAWAALGLWP